MPIYRARMVHKGQETQAIDFEANNIHEAQREANEGHPDVLLACHMGKPVIWIDVMQVPREKKG